MPRKMTSVAEPATPMRMSSRALGYLPPFRNVKPPMPCSTMLLGLPNKRRTTACPSSWTMTEMKTAIVHEQEHRAPVPVVPEQHRDEKKGNSIRTGIGPMRKRVTVAPEIGAVPFPYEGAWYRSIASESARAAGFSIENAPSAAMSR
jgi:hypothetical protein